MKLRPLIQMLETIAPPALAEEWDNTGLLIAPLRAREIRTVLLTVDLTEAVAREAVRLRAGFIVSYHPLFFGGIRRLDAADPQARTAMRLIEKGIGAYSPHTALDGAPGGVNDWLAGLFGGDIAADGAARIVTLPRAITPAALAKTAREKLKLKTVRLADGGRAVRTLAVCAGAGIDALRDIKADGRLTGEMKHHDVLAAREAGISIILCGHTETERGYLPVLRRRMLSESDGSLKVLISKADTAPLRTA